MFASLEWVNLVRRHGPAVRVDRLGQGQIHPGEKQCGDAERQAGVPERKAEGGDGGVDPDIAGVESTSGPADTGPQMKARRPGRQR